MKDYQEAECRGIRKGRDFLSVRHLNTFLAPLKPLNRIQWILTTHMILLEQNRSSSSLSQQHPLLPQHTALRQSEQATYLQIAW